MIFVIPLRNDCGVLGDSLQRVMEVPDAATHVFKICSVADWEACQASGVLPLAPIDAADGYVHLSGKADVQGTLDLYFRGNSTALVVVEFAPENLTGLEVRWEGASDGNRGDRLFPHAYGGQLTASAAVACHPVTATADGHVVEWQ